MENQTDTDGLATTPVMTKQEMMALLKDILDKGYGANTALPLKEWLDVFDRYCTLAEYL